jgi:hypothetical protein
VAVGTIVAWVCRRVVCEGPAWCKGAGRAARRAGNLGRPAGACAAALELAFVQFQLYGDEAHNVQAMETIDVLEYTYNLRSRRWAWHHHGEFVIHAADMDRYRMRTRDELEALEG